VDCARQRVRQAPLTGRHADHDLACVDVGLAVFASRSERLRALRTYLGDAASGEGLRHRAAAVEALHRRLAAEEERRLPSAIG
jgi:hypothetical protein